MPFLTEFTMLDTQVLTNLGHLLLYWFSFLPHQCVYTPNITIVYQVLWMHAYSLRSISYLLIPMWPPGVPFQYTVAQWDQGDRLCASTPCTCTHPYGHEAAVNKCKTEGHMGKMP